MGKGSGLGKSARMLAGVVLAAAVACGGTVYGMAALVQRLQVYEAEQQAARRAELLSRLDEATALMRDAVASIDAALGEHREDGAREVSAGIEDLFLAYEAFEPEPEADPGALRAVRQDLTDRRTFLSTSARVHSEAGGAVLVEDTMLQGAERDLSALQVPFRDSEAVKELQGLVAKRRKALAKDVAAARHAMDLTEQCGPPPAIIGGRSVEAEYALAEVAHDPSSVTSARCTTPMLTEACWQFSCIMRATNAFGALVAEEYTFRVGMGRTVIVTWEH